MPSRLSLAPAVLAAALSAACEYELDEAVPTDVCASGRRWIGENIGHEEMHPGRDCIGCHLEQDGPVMLAAGTVYGQLDNEIDVANDCFGLEGVEVQLTGANGRVFRTTTNRAGNFFFEGPESALQKPFRAELFYTTPEGAEANPTMQHRPFYGGCARCHNPAQQPSEGVPPQSRFFVRPAAGLFVQ